MNDDLLSASHILDICGFISLCDQFFTRDHQLTNISMFQGTDDVSKHPGNEAVTRASYNKL
jgi:hypothetical protein